MIDMDKIEVLCQEPEEVDSERLVEIASLPGTAVRDENIRSTDCSLRSPYY